MIKKGYLFLIAICIGVLVGILANRNRERLINAQFIRDHLHFRKKIENPQLLINDTTTVIFLAFGQSNSANYGNGSYTCRNDVYNFYKNDLYQAKEPLLGPDGGGCSVWTRVADMMIDSGMCKKVIIVPIGIGQTSISKWVDGDCRDKLDETLTALKKQGIKLTYIFWNQGETDNVDKTSKAQYAQKLNELIDIFREQGIKAPFYPSITSYFPYNNEHPFGINREITGAQMEVINERSDVLPGPNTDSLNLAYYRADAVHFTEKGLDKLADAWYRRIIKNK